MKKISEILLNITNFNINLEMISWIIVLFFSGCNKAEVLVSSLGRPIPTPTLVSAKLDPYSFCSPNYIEYEGQCHEKINNFEISIDQENWIAIPIKVPIYDESGKQSAFEVSSQDIQCGSDKKFKFKISLIWLEKAVQKKKNQINTIYLRGVDGSMTSLAFSDNTLNGMIQSCNIPGNPKGKDYGIDKTMGGPLRSGSIYRLRGGLVQSLGGVDSHGDKYIIKSGSSKLTQ